MQTTFESEHPKVVALSRLAHESCVRADGSDYFDHPEWVAKQIYYVLTELQPAYPEHLTKDRIDAGVAGAYLHDAVEKDPFITRDAIEVSSNTTPRASEVGYIVLLLTYDKPKQTDGVLGVPAEQSPFMEYTKNRVTLHPLAMLTKVGDIAHNLLVAPKPEESQSIKYKGHLQEYMDTVDYYLANAAILFPDEPWLELAMRRLLDIASEQLHPDLPLHITDWLKTTTGQAVHQHQLGY